MHDIRNSDGRLVCRIEESTGTIEISIKGCITWILPDLDGSYYIINISKN